MDPQINYALVTPPTSGVMTLEEAKAHLRVVDDSDDDLIAAQLLAATAAVEKMLGRALMVQVWAATIDGGFPCRPVCRGDAVGGRGESLVGFAERKYGIGLRPVPVGTVTSVQYVDADGDTSLLPSQEYQVLARMERPGAIIPAYNGTYGGGWPACKPVAGAVTVTFTAGYPDAASVPAGIVHYIKLLLGNMYTQREQTITGTIQADLEWASGLIDMWRVQ